MRKLFVCRKRNRRGVDSESQGVFTPEKKEAVLQKQDNSDALLMNLNAFSNLYPKHAEFAS